MSFEFIRFKSISFWGYFILSSLVLILGFLINISKRWIGLSASGVISIIASSKSAY